jgi:peptide-methionine (R)-S-oxide reductase
VTRNKKKKIKMSSSPPTTKLSKDTARFNLPSNELDRISADEGEEYAMHFEEGVYTCARCGNPLYKSGSKFASHCRWPAFRDQYSPDAIIRKEDSTYGWKRTEILCGKCHLHLGHVFNDGKFSGDKHPDAGTRHCVLSMSLDFKPLNK